MLAAAGVATSLTATTYTLRAVLYRAVTGEAVFGTRPVAHAACVGAFAVTFIYFATLVAIIDTSKFHYNRRYLMLRVSNP